MTWRFRPSSRSAWGDVPTTASSPLPGGGRGYRIFLGGHWGRTGAAGREMPSLLPDEEGVLAFIEKVLSFYKGNGLPGERFCKTLDRLGFEQVLSVLA